MQHMPYDPFGGRDNSGKSPYGDWSYEGPGLSESIRRGAAAGWRLIARLFRRRARTEEEKPSDAESAASVESPTIHPDLGDEAPPPEETMPEETMPPEAEDRPPPPEETKRRTRPKSPKTAIETPPEPGPEPGDRTEPAPSEDRPPAQAPETSDGPGPAFLGTSDHAGSAPAETLFPSGDSDVSRRFNLDALPIMPKDRLKPLDPSIAEALPKLPKGFFSPPTVESKETHYRRMGEAGHSRYYLELAKMFHAGEEVPQDLDKAMEYYWLASQRKEFLGYSFAAAKLAKLEEQQLLKSLSVFGRLAYGIRKAGAAARDRYGFGRWPSRAVVWVYWDIFPDFARIRYDPFKNGWTLLTTGLLLSFWLIPAGIAVLILNGVGWETFADWVVAGAVLYALYPGVHIAAGAVLMVVVAFPARVGKAAVDVWRAAIKAMARAWGGPVRAVGPAAAAGAPPPMTDMPLPENDQTSGGGGYLDMKNWLIGLLLLAVLGAGAVYTLYDEGPWPTMAKGYRLFDNSRYAQAINVFSGITKKYPDFAEGHAALGHALTVRERFGDAVTAYSKAIGIDDEYVGAYLGRGWVRWFTGRLEGAADDYRATVRLDPEVYGYYLELERVLYELDRPGEVAEFWKKVAQRKPDWGATARVKRVMALEKDENWRVLRREIPAMLPMDAHKNDPHLHYLLGRALNEANRHDKAVANLKRAVDMLRYAAKPDLVLIQLYGEELKYTYVWNGEIQRGRSWEQELNRLLAP